MIDREARTELATCLLRLVTGEITNDEFDDRYGDDWLHSDDAAVAEIATFGWSLYSDVVPYRLTDRKAVTEETRQVANRAILFLQSDLDYEWPRNVKGVVPYWCLWGPGCYLVIGVTLLFIASLGGQVFVGLFGLLAIMPTCHWLFTHRNRVTELKHFRESGEFHVWPFFRQHDYDEATRSK